MKPSPHQSTDVSFDLIEAMPNASDQVSGERNTVVTLGFGRLWWAALWRRRPFYVPYFVLVPSANRPGSGDKTSTLLSSARRCGVQKVDLFFGKLRQGQI